MKRIISLFLLTMLLLPAVHSQVEMFPIGAEWHYESDHSGVSFHDKSYHYSVVEKDTVVAGKPCRLVVSNNGNKEIIYEDSGRVYYFFKDKFRKIYDFNVNAGDTVELSFKTSSGTDPYNKEDTAVLSSCFIESVSTRVVDNMELKEVSAICTYSMYSPPSESYPYPSFDTTVYRHRYLEKIGVEDPGLAGFDVIFPTCPNCAFVPEYYYRLRCYRDSDIDYTTAWWIGAGAGKPCDFEYFTSNTVEKINTIIKLFPNPAKNELTLSGDYLQKVTVAIYDMSGKTVLEQKESIPCNLNIQHLVSGTYYIKVFDNKSCLISKKFMKL